MSSVEKHARSWLKRIRTPRVNIALFLAMLLFTTAVAHACDRQAHNASHVTAYSLSAHNHPAAPADDNQDTCRFVRGRITSWEASKTGLDLVTELSQAALSTTLQVTEPLLVKFLLVTASVPLLDSIKRPLLIINLVVRI
jgi:hypothetical protein